ncbi:hypothetical protein Peur_023120 [Populus x canadensis]|uniref:Uncharacterized protein n=1 Tax=Populus trichocarpa TaxID=3694 RepID=A0A2K1XNJ4_POPTR
MDSRGCRRHDYYYSTKLKLARCRLRTRADLHLDVVQNRQNFSDPPTSAKERLKSSIVETAVQDQTLRSPAQATCDKI